MLALTRKFMDEKDQLCTGKNLNFFRGFAKVSFLRK